MIREAEEEEKRHKEKIDSFKKQCAKQLDENKYLKEIQRQKEIEEDNKPPSGRNLMTQIYEEKKHISYQKRERNDKILSLIQDQLSGGQTVKRQMQEENAMNNYIQKKNQADLNEDERRRKLKKERESDMKRMLDLQLQERDEKVRLGKFENQTEAKYINKDVQAFNSVQEEKKKQMENYIQAHQTKLVAQISEKQLPKKLETQDLVMNKSLLKQIAAQKI